MSKKQILSAVIAAAMITCSLPAAAYVPDINAPTLAEWNGTDTKEPKSEYGFYQISSAAELAWFAAKINSGENDLSAILTTDIDLEGKEWTPIGTADKQYRGRFDGSNHTISNLHITSSSSDAGLFGTVGESGRVEYLTIENAEISSSKNAGVVAGNVAGGRISSVTVKNAKLTGGVSSATGGIAGVLLEGGIAENCIFGGSISNAEISGGIAGIISGSSEINNSRSNADIKISDKTIGFKDTVQAGGIVGKADVTKGNTTVSNCYSTGPIDVSVLTAARAGGIAGYIGYANPQLSAPEDPNSKAIFKTSYSVSPIKSDVKLHVGNLFGETVEDFLLDASNVYFNSEINSASLHENPLGDFINENGDSNPGTSLTAKGLTTAEMKSKDFTAATSSAFTDKTVGPGFVFVEGDYPDIAALQYKEVPSNIGISSAEEYNIYARLINDHEHYNADTYYTDMIYALDTDIDFGTLNGDAEHSNAVQIGTESRPFTGKFDFNNRSVKNVHMYDKNAALFGYIENAELSRVKIEDSYFGKYDTAEFAAAVVFSCNNSTVSNSDIASSVHISASSTAAGVAVFATGSTLSSNTNAAPIASTTSGFDSSPKTGAGIVADCKNSTIQGNKNNAEIYAQTIAAGIAANSTESTTLKSNTNSGNVTSSGSLSSDENSAAGISAISKNSILKNNKNSGNVSAKGSAAGISAVAEFSDITENENSGNITGLVSAGGIVGKAVFGESGNSSADTVQFIKNANTGNISASSDSTEENHAGGIAGYIRSSIPVDFSYNYCVGNIDAKKATAGGLAGKIDIDAAAQSKMRRSYFAGKADGSSTGALVGDLNAGIRVLRVFFDNTLCNDKDLFFKTADPADIEDSVYGLPSESMIDSRSFQELLGVCYTYALEGNELLNGGYPVFMPGADISQDDDEVEDDSLIVDDADGYYMIKNAAQLRKFSEMSTKQGYGDAKYKLMNDINLGASWDENGKLISGEKWTPIAMGTSTTGAYKFEGEFDGQGHSISGLYTDVETSFGGLFGNLVGAKIRNVSVTSGYVKAVDFVGGIAGSASGGTVIENCSSSAELHGNTDVGGIVGNLQKSTISGCSNSGNVTASGTEAGGIVGYMDSCEITDVKNSGNVTNENVANAGGIAGYIETSSSIKNAVNTGDVNAKLYAGGIAGSIFNDVTLTGVYSSGNITSSDIAGGIIGKLGINSKAGANVSADLSDITLSGKVSALGKYAGGVIGDLSLYNGNIKISGADISPSVISAKEVSGGIIGYQNFKTRYTFSATNTAVRALIDGNDKGAFIGTLLMDDDAEEAYGIVNSFFIGGGTDVLIYETIDEDEEPLERTIDKCYMISAVDGKILVDNPTAAKIKCDALIAAYSPDGELEDIDIVGIEVDGGASAEYETTISKGQLFAWDSVNTMCPIGFLSE